MTSVIEKLFNMHIYIYITSFIKEHTDNHFLGLVSSGMFLSAITDNMQEVNVHFLLY